MTIFTPSYVDGISYIVLRYSHITTKTRPTVISFPS